MNNKELQARIKRLEDALFRIDKPSGDSECECCGSIYVPSSFGSVRCPSCCTGCMYNKETKTWIRSVYFCPLARSQQY